MPKTTVNSDFTHALSPRQQADASNSKAKASTKKASVPSAPDATNTAWPRFKRIRAAFQTSNAVTTTSHNPLPDEHHYNNDYGLLLALQAKVEEQKKPRTITFQVMQLGSLKGSFYYLEKTLFEHLTPRVKNLLKKDYLKEGFIFRRDKVDSFLQLTRAQLAAMAEFDLSTLPKKATVFKPEIAINAAVTASEMTSPAITGTTGTRIEATTHPLPAIVAPTPATFVGVGTIARHTLTPATLPLTSLSLTSSSTQTTIGHHLNTLALLNEHPHHNDYGVLLALQAKVAQQKNSTLPLFLGMRLSSVRASLYLEKTLFAQLSPRVQNLLKEEYLRNGFIFRRDKAERFLQLTRPQLAAMANINVSTLHENVTAVKPEIAAGSLSRLRR